KRRSRAAAPNGKPLARRPALDLCVSGSRSRYKCRGQRRATYDQRAAHTQPDSRMAEIAQSVGAILEGKVEAYPARLATARFFAAHLSNHDRDRDPGCGRCRGNRIHLMTGHVIVTDADGIRTIRMNRPDKKNALTLAMYEAMTAALEGAN